MQQNKKTFLLVILLLLVGVGLFFVLHKNPKTPASTSDTLVVANDYKIYSNPTAGLAFEYPPEWRVEVSEDSVTHGDIMKDGETYTSFTGSIFPPDWNEGTTPHIGFYHSPLASPINGGPEYKSADNLSVAEQFKFLNCVNDEENSCVKTKNKNGVEFMLWDGYDTQEGKYISAVVPTSKYIITFILVGDSQHVLDESSPAIAVFENVIDGVKLTSIVNQKIDSSLDSYVDPKFNFEFKFPKEFVLTGGDYPVHNQSDVSIVLSEGIQGPTKVRIASNNNEFYKPPQGTNLRDWVIGKFPTRELPEGQFSSRIGQDFSIDGLPTLHTMDNTFTGGAFDTFYFIKNERLFEIQIMGDQEKYTSNGQEYIKLHNIDLNSNKWYVDFLRSFKFR